jgi:Ribbon-helix-helix protein, copG family
MAVARDNLQVRIPKPAKESFTRLCRFTERSQSKLIEILIRLEEQSWLNRLADNERCRYLEGRLTLAEISSASAGLAELLNTRQTEAS